MAIIHYSYTNNMHFLCNVFNTKGCFYTSGPIVSLDILIAWIEYHAARMRIMSLITPVMIACYLSRI